MQLLNLIRQPFLSFLCLTLHILTTSAMFPFPLLNFSSLTRKNYQTHEACADLSLECVERQSLCNDESFAHIMKKKCKKTCSECTPKKEWLSLNKPENSRLVMSPPDSTRNENLQLSFHPGFALSSRQNESLKENVSNSINEIEKDDLRKDSEEVEFKHGNVEIKIDEDYLLATNKIQNILQQAPFFNFLEIQNAKLHAPTKPNEITVQGRIPITFPSSNPYAPKQLKKRRPNKNQQCVDQSGWECRWKRHLCRNTFYTTVMRRNCAKTCGFCKSKSKPKPGGYPMKTKKTSPYLKSYTRRFEKFVPSPQSQFSTLLPANIIFPKSTPRFSPNFPQFRIPKPNSGQFLGKFGNMGVVFPDQQHQNMVTNRQNSFFNHLYVPCVNTALDCDEKLDLCTHQHYWKLMRRVCALSCEFCENEFL